MMKKNKLLFILLIVIILLFNSCKYNPKDDTLETTIDDSENETTTSQNDIGNLGFNEGYLPTLCGIDEYNKFIKQNNLPKRFIYFDSLINLGTFKALGIQRSNCSVIFYTVTDSADNSLALSIYDETIEPYVWESESQITYVNLTASDINRSDMRTSENKARNSIYTENGIAYNYLKGNLLSISWRVNNYMFILSGNASLADINIESPTFVSSLLTSTKTIPEIMAQISLPVVAE